MAKLWSKITKYSKSIWSSIQKPFKILNKWETLRIIGNQKIVQLTILIPVIGYYIIFSEQFCTLTTTIKSIDIGISCSEYPSQKTFLLYFGFSFLAFGSLLYSFFCPALIKKYSDKHEYVKNEKELFDRHTVEITAFKLAYTNSGKILPSDIKYPLQSIRAEQEKFLDIAKKTVSGDIDINKVKPKYDAVGKAQSEAYDYLYAEQLEQIMGLNYESYENHNAFLRVITAFFYVAGFSIIGLLATQTFIKILTIYFANLFG